MREGEDWKKGTEEDEERKKMGEEGILERKGKEESRIEEYSIRIV